jgi:hypothetical protein
MTASKDHQMLSLRDPVWFGLGLALLIFAVLIVVEISLAPTYIDVRVEVEGYTFDWDQPVRTTASIESEEGWPVRYFLSQRSAEVCPQGTESRQSLEAGLQAWAAENNWGIINPSQQRSCQNYADLGLDVGMDMRDAVTLKPLGWDEGQEWNATLCVAMAEGDPCGWMMITSVVPSIGVMVSEQ